MGNGIGKLYDEILDAFGSIQRPSATEMIHPRFRMASSSGNQSQEATMIDRVLGHLRWQGVRWKDFDWEDELIQGPSAPAEYAQSVFNCLSDSGVAYYTPSVMLIVISEGLDAEILFQWLLDRLDPDWVGSDVVESTFGRWGMPQVDTLLRFLEWALANFKCQSYDGQGDAVLKYWKAKGRW